MSKPPTKRPGLKISEIQEGAARRARGRPKGTGSGTTTRKISVSLPIDLYDWLIAQPNASAEVTSALRAYLAKPRRK